MCCVHRSRSGANESGVEANTHRNRPPGPAALNFQPGLYARDCTSVAGDTSSPATLETTGQEPLVTLYPIEVVSSVDTAAMDWKSSRMNATSTRWNVSR